MFWAAIALANFLLFPDPTAYRKKNIYIRKLPGKYGLWKRVCERSFCNNKSLPIASASDALKVAKFQKEFRKTNEKTHSYCQGGQ